MKKHLNDLRYDGGGKISTLKDENFIFPKRMCKMYKNIRFGNKSFFNNLSSENISIGFTILLHDQIEQFERLLIALYHPNNVYCVHVDAKSSDVIKMAVKSIANCFDNVFLATKLEYIVYAGFSRLRADLNCMSDLLHLGSLIGKHENLMEKRDIQWK